MPNQKVHSFYDELYGVTYHLFVNTSKAKLNNFLLKNYNTVIQNSDNVDELAGCCIELTTKKGSVIVIALCSAFTNTPECHGTLVHECYHAAEFVLRNRGVQSNKTTSEAWAYYLGYLIEQVLGKLMKKRKPRK
jgi:hypothetical protein